MTSTPGFDWKILTSVLSFINMLKLMKTISLIELVVTGIMTDRITQLQEETNLLASYMCDSIGRWVYILIRLYYTGQKDYHITLYFVGVLQNAGADVKKSKSDIALFSKLICDTCSNINLLVDSLPTVSKILCL